MFPTSGGRENHCNGMFPMSGGRENHCNGMFPMSGGQENHCNGMFPMSGGQENHCNGMFPMSGGQENRCRPMSDTLRTARNAETPRRLRRHPSTRGELRWRGGGGPGNAGLLPRICTSGAGAPRSQGVRLYPRAHWTPTIPHPHPRPLLCGRGIADAKTNPAGHAPASANSPLVEGWRRQPTGCFSVIRPLDS
jgi:hypothetical protein